MATESGLISQIRIWHKFGQRRKVLCLIVNDYYSLLLKKMHDMQHLNFATRAIDIGSLCTLSSFFSIFVNYYCYYFCRI